MSQNGHKNNENLAAKVARFFKVFLTILGYYALEG